MATFPQLPQLMQPLEGGGSQGVFCEKLDVRTVHREHATFVWRSLQRLGVRGAELDDAHQEVFIVVHRKLGTFDDASAKLTSWLFGICMRVASAARRKAHRRHEVLTCVMPEQGSGVDTGPEGRLQQRQAAELVDRVLDTLDLEKRAIFVMFEMDQLSCQEIADIVDVPLGTVHSRLHAARSEFQEGIRRNTLREQHASRSAALGASSS